MDRLIAALKTVLEQETKEYKLILELADKKKQALIKNDVDTIDGIVSKEWMRLKKIKQLEYERESLIERIAALCRMQKETLRIEHIIDVLQGEVREEFVHIREELARTLSELSGRNLENRGLIDTHLAYTNFCVNLLTGHLNSKIGNYSHSGAMTQRPESANLLVDQMV